MDVDTEAERGQRSDARRGTRKVGKASVTVGKVVRWSLNPGNDRCQPFIAAEN